MRRGMFCELKPSYTYSYRSIISFPVPPYKEPAPLRRIGLNFKEDRSFEGSVPPAQDRPLPTQDWSPLPLKKPARLLFLRASDSLGALIGVELAFGTQADAGGHSDLWVVVGGPQLPARQVDSSAQTAATVGPDNWAAQDPILLCLCPTYQLVFSPVVP